MSKPVFASISVLVLVIAATWGLTSSSSSTEHAMDSDVSLIPLPASIERGSGAFSLREGTTVRLSDPNDPGLRELGAFIVEMTADAGAPATLSSDPAHPRARNVIQLVLDDDVAEANGEAYRIHVSSRSISISAPAHAGLFYGVQTLRQLLPPSDGQDAAGVEAVPVTVPAITIEDTPRFVYRGMHLDVARHFFPVSFVKRYIDLIAMYKMNRFHWHLTEDQGWRIEIKKYPRLTEVGAYRKETILEKNFSPYVGDGQPHGGFYTQDEVREVVDYARSRHVTVIPEIEMPGHSLAALAAYPELACTDGPFEVGTVWGVYDDIYCPSEQTFAFLENVLTEVMELFPSRYIHIGGDEAPKTRWETSPIAQGVMEREGLADEHELQSYFIKRIERFLRDHGRQLIGWDEILEGGLAPEATVMSWRGMDGGIAAAKLGHDVIMTPGSHVYFDHYQGDRDFEPLAIGGYTPLEKVYRFEPVPPSLTPREARHVLGGQGNVWTEYMSTPDHVEYMVFPRLLALSEVLWSPRDARDWNSFVSRLAWHFHDLDRRGVAYRVPHVRGVDGTTLTLADDVMVELGAPVPHAEIRYTLDGTDPDSQSIVYEGPFVLPVDEIGTEVRTRAFLPNGRMSPLARGRFMKTELQPAREVTGTDMQPGLQYAYYEGRMSSVKRLARFEPRRRGVATTVTLQGFEPDEYFGLVFQGFLRVPRDGVYRFWLASDDGSDLVIGNETVIDHDGLHSATDQLGMIALEAGFHPLTLRFFQAGGGKSLMLTGKHEDDEEFSTMEGWFFSTPDR